MNYKQLYYKELKRSERLQKKVNLQREELDNHFKYIQKQTIVIHLLQERIKELKGLK